MAKYQVLGSLVKAARRALRLSEKELADRLGVSVTTVASWERGISRPREELLDPLCAVLEVDRVVLLEAGFYVRHEPSSRVRMLVLPFGNLSDDEFERFCAELFAARHPDANVTRNGSTGEKQFGVDVYVNTPTERVGVQCKRRSQFAQHDIEAVVAELKPEAGVDRGIIALSRETASAGARRAMSAHPNWALVDGEGLSRMVRELPLERGARMVDTYFHGLTEAFLGVKEPSPWLSLDEIADTPLGPGGTQPDFPLVGRDAELARLRELVDTAASLTLLVGRGGLGKTRLLRELASLESGREVRFTHRGPVSPDSYRLLPEGAPILVIDDAAEVESDLPALIDGIRRERPEASIVLSARPRSLTHLRARLGISQLDVADRTVQLQDLSLVDAEKLANDALGEAATTERARLLARVGYDCPFLIVVGARLVVEGKLRDADLVSGVPLRDAILDVFANVGTGEQAAERGRVLASVAALQPAPLDDDEFLGTLAVLADLPVDRLLETIDSLGHLGFVLRRGTTVRVVPDLLGDSILDRALVSELGIRTGFANRIADNATGRALFNAIRNVSIIDWRRRSSGQELALADVLWSAVVEHSLKLPNTQRVALGRHVAAVAAIYPEHALDLVDAWINSPAPDEDAPFAALVGQQGKITTEEVLRACTRLIANAAHDRTQLGRAMRMLFEIGRHDSRPENQHPEHPLRLLRELGGYESRQSVEFYSSFVRNVEAMLARELDPAGRAILVGLLSPVLEDEVTYTDSWAMTLTFTRKSINLDAVAPVREVAIAAALRSLNDVPRVALRAIEVLKTALATGDRSAPLTPEFAMIASHLKAMIGSSDQAAVVRLSAYNALSWHATYGEGERRACAREIRQHLVRDDSYIIARQIRAGWDLDDDDDDNNSTGDAADGAVDRYHRSQARLDAEVERLVEQWVADGLANELLERVRRAIEAERDAANVGAVPERLVTLLMQRSPDLARAVLANDLLETDIDDDFMRIALMVSLESGAPGVVQVAERLSELGERGSAVVASAAMSASNVSEEREAIIRRCLKSTHMRTHRIVVAGARWLAEPWRGLIADILEAVPIEQDPRVAESAMWLLTHGRLLTWTSLPNDVRAKLLARFALCPRLNAHVLNDLLNAEIGLDPFAALEFLKTRIDQAGIEDGYEPLPFLGSMHLEFSESTSLPTLLEDLATWIIEGEQTWRRHHIGTQLLRDMMAGYHDASKAFLKRLIESQAEERVLLARSLLDEAPQDLVLSHEAFTVELIELAATLPTELRVHVIRGLHGSAAFGVHSRTVGMDDTNDVALRDGATEVASRLPAGSAEREFYEDVAQFARQRLAAERTSDLEFEQARDWDASH